jgi:hypothetical protein
MCGSVPFCAGVRKALPVLVGADDGDPLGVVPFLVSVVEASPLILWGSSEETLLRVFLAR